MFVPSLPRGKEPHLRRPTFYGGLHHVFSFIPLPHSKTTVIISESNQHATISIAFHDGKVHVKHGFTSMGFVKSMAGVATRFVDHRSLCHVDGVGREGAVKELRRPIVGDVSCKARCEGYKRNRRSLCEMARS
jgi:hypothetical protein